MESEKVQVLTACLIQQEELLKEAVILARGAEVCIQGLGDDDLFQMLLEKYPKSVKRFEILYKRFSCLHRLEQKRIHLLKKASFDKERKRIVHQNRLFSRFCQKATVPLVPTSPGLGICLGVTLDLIAKKITGKPKQPLIGPTARGRRLQQKYLDARVASIEKLQALYSELGTLHFEKPVRYFTLYEMLCQKWSKTFEAIGGKKVQREFLRAKKIFEKRKLRGNRTNLALYKKFFRKVNEYALQLIEEVHASVIDDLGLEIIPIFTNEDISVETFIKNLKVYTKKFRKPCHAFLQFQSEIEKSHHGIYCSLYPPYEIQDANFPGFAGFRTSDLAEFQLFLCFWSCFYDFSSFRSLYRVSKRF